MPRKGSHTRKKRPGLASAASVGPATCSPLASTRRNNRNSCLSDDVLVKVANANSKKRGGSIHTNKNTNVDKNALAKELGCDVTDERCLIEKSLLSHREKKALLQSFFRPKMPEAWKKDPDLWLNSDDIANVMKQYEAAYKEFKFLGVVPIDFSAPNPYVEGSETGSKKQCMNQQFCTVDLKEERAAGRKILGAVFNLDPHYKGGSHWIALAIDLARNCVYYFDSYGMAPPKQVVHYMRYLTIQDPELRLERNGRRFQYSKSECGMYSMYFLIRMIAGENFKKFCKTPVADKEMLKFRKVLFDAKA